MAMSHLVAVIQEYKRFLLSSQYALDITGVCIGIFLLGILKNRKILHMQSQGYIPMEMGAGAD